MLTPREEQIIERFMEEGESHRDVAMHFGISVDTLKCHLAHIFDKTGYGSTLELVVRTYQKRMKS